MLLVGALVLVGCSRTPAPGAEDTADQLAAALSAGTIHDLPVANDSARAEVDYEQITESLDGPLPDVTVDSVEYSAEGNHATVSLTNRYSMADQYWTFTTSAGLTLSHHQWEIEWQPSLVHPDLSDQTKLSHERTKAKRGSIIGSDGLAIVKNRGVFKVGIDKPQIDESAWENSALALAALVEVDPETYAAQVAASGPQAFVPAITYRDGQVPSEIDQIPGAVALPDTLPLGPSPTFAIGILGTASEASAEDLANTSREITAGDFVGHSGLQKIHDAQLRGEPGHTINLVDRTDEQLAQIGSFSHAASSSDSPVATQTDSSEGKTKKVLFSVGAKNGTDLKLTIDVALQSKAETVLSGNTKNIVSLAVLDRSSGAVLAAAESPAANGQSYSTYGSYPPGSTMKIATSLALIRQGYHPTSTVDCSPTATVNGRVFNNWPNYPQAFTGKIALTDAVKMSCNTAFLNASGHISDEQFIDAAASLGLGVDYDTGFGAFYGSVPATDDPVEHAAGMIGQGKVLMSPLVLAAEAASVANGRTTIGYLIQDQKPSLKSTELTEDEASQLREMMRQVVANGTGSRMQGTLEGAKTGTAEYGESSEHSWIVGWTDSYAIAAMSYNGDGADKQAVIDFING